MNDDVSNHVRKREGYTVRVRITAWDQAAEGRARYDVRVCLRGEVVSRGTWYSPLCLSRAIDSREAIDEIVESALCDL